MSAVATAIPSSIRAQRQARAARARAASRARFKARAEPLILFALTTGALTALGLRTTVHLHLIYPAALTRLSHAYIAWWDQPPRFRAIGFAYPPLQSVWLLPFALLRPLATSLIALPISSALCGGVVIATLDRTLVLLGVNWWARLALLVLFAANPLFLDYGANGMATSLVMALLAVGLHNFCAWYVRGGDSVRSLGFCGTWLAIAFLARYETIVWLVLIMAAVALVRLRRGAGFTEVLALEAILAAPVVYIFLIWSGVSTLVGGGGPLSWITRAGAEVVSGLNYGGRVSTGARIGGIFDVLWHTSPLLIAVPVLLTLAAALLRRPFLVIIAAAVLAGAALSAVRMDLRANAELLQPAYQMLALVPMLIGAGWLIALLPGRRSLAALTGRAVVTVLLTAGLAASAVTAFSWMKHDANQYDQAFTVAISSHLRRIPSEISVRTAPSYVLVGPNNGSLQLYEDDQAVATFLQAAVYAKKAVLIDDLALPGVILAQDTTVPFRTRAENGDAFWTRFLQRPFTRGKLHYLVVGNPKLTPSGYPRDLISARYPNAYSGGMPHTEVVFRTPLIAVVELQPSSHARRSSLLPSNAATVQQLYDQLPALSMNPHL